MKLAYSGMYKPLLVDSSYYGGHIGDILKAGTSVYIIAHSTKYMNFDCPTYLGEAYVSVDR